jgi:signal peptidase I
MGEPAASMAPAIMAGDRLLIWKGPFQPCRGDIIAFRSPAGDFPSLVLAKRLVAFGGETIEFRNEQVYINNARLEGGVFAAMRYRPVARQGFAGEGNPFVVPPGHLFLVGDNSAASLDSRQFGPVPARDVIGKVYKRYWPMGRAGPLW